MYKHFLYFFVLLLPYSSFSQEEEITIELHDHSKSTKRNRVSFMMATTYIFNTVNSDDHGEFHSSNTFVPTIGVNYSYIINRKFAIALLNDVELASYTIKVDDLKYQSRDYRYIVSIVAGYKIAPHFMVMLGYGFEFEKNETYHLIRTGLEYDIRLRDYWDVLFGINYDYKEDYSTISFSISFGKSFGKVKPFKK